MKKCSLYYLEMCIQTITNSIKKVLFWWIVPLIQLAREHELTPEDIGKLPSEHRTKILERTLSRNWEKALQKANPNLLHVIFKTFKIKYFQIVFFHGSREWIARVGQGVCLIVVITHVDCDSSSEVGIFAGTLLVAFVYLSAFTARLTFFRALILAMEVRVSLTAIIYKKALRLSLDEYNLAQVINLISNDVNQFDRYMYAAGYWVVAPIQFILVFTILWHYMGPSVVGGLALLLCISAGQFVVGRFFNKIRLDCAQKTDLRVRHTTELIRGIQWIKMSTWEEPFAEIIGKARQKELKQFLYKFQLTFADLSLTELGLKLCQFLILFLYVRMGDSGLTGKVFVMTVLLNYVGSSFAINFAFSVIGFFECLASAQRIQKFLLLSDKEVVRPLMNVGETFLLELKNVTSSWSMTSNAVLFDINFQLSKGQIIGFIGPIGSGKSSLLKTILRELRLRSGKIETRTNKIAYVSQEPWIFPATVLDNILFGLPYDEIWFQQVLSACCLGHDLQLMPHGMQTFLGDRGVTLSGGQKARINLARAVYANADLILIDDIFSGLDVNVAGIIMSRCIKGLLASKAIILVTHQVQHLETANAIFMLKNGYIEKRGTFKEIIHSSQRTWNSMDSDMDIVDSLEPDSCTCSTDETFSQKHGGYGTFATKNPEDSEDQKRGSFKFTLHWSYWSAGGKGLFSCLIFLFVGAQAFGSLSDYWIKIWIQDCSSPTSGNVGTYNTLIYLSLIMAFGITAFCRGFFFAKIGNNCSRVFHKRFLTCILRAPMRFFEINTPGRVLNRFVNDLGVIDDFIQPFYMTALDPLVQGLGTMIIIGVALPFTIIPGILVLLIIQKLRHFYLPAGSSLKRIETMARSPVLGILNSTVAGIVTIRASKSEELMQNEFEKLQDAHSAANYAYIAANRWLVFSSDCTAATYVLFVVVYCFLMGVDSTTTGFAISSSIFVTMCMYTACYFLAELDNGIISVERILDYSAIESEADPVIAGSRPSPKWPNSGKIDLNNCTVRYGSSPPVLHSINLKIKPNEKIGIIGRTGSGKSSLISSLFRLVELDSGSIHVDGIDISRIGLGDLRSKISIIPQNPVLFIGSLRMNLDPFGRCDDAQLMSVLREVDFAYPFEGKQGLDTKISGGGGNLSHGERQLLCLARVMLENNKILVLDEATAHMDRNTDARIQATLQSKFVDKSVIVVAHRLSTVMDKDKILVLGDGRVLECDHPYVLLQNPKGRLFELCQKVGHRLRAQFIQTAIKSYREYSGRK